MFKVLVLQTLYTLSDDQTEYQLRDRLLQFSKPKLLIVDELRYLPFEPNAAQLFFQLVSRRYETGSMLVTSNRAVGEWGTVFDDAVTCSTGYATRSGPLGKSPLFALRAHMATPGPAAKSRGARVRRTSSVRFGAPDAGAYEGRFRFKQITQSSWQFSSANSW
jgi:IstB-like ATP binding protein